MDEHADKPAEAESFLMFDSGAQLFYFKATEDQNPATAISIDAMEMAILKTPNVKMKDVLTFLVDAARKKPGTWMSASSQKVKPGQGVI
jgi:hypothetical protein